jgi:hypothetical protein
MKATIVGFCAAASLLVSAAGAAAADSKCSSVSIEVKNEYRDPVTGAQVDIKVVDFQYWDAEDNKWREEWSDNKRINYGQTAVWNKNLEYVGGESGVKIKVYFKYDQAGGKWSTDHTAVSTVFQCVDGKTVPITIK